MNPAPGSDQRRANRVEVDVLVMVEGIDDHMVRRHGNMSATGVYFEAKQKLTEVGSLEYLHIATIDQAKALTVMAQLVRIVECSPERVGHAFEMFPQSDEIQASLDELLDAVGATAPVQEPTDSLPSANIFRLTVEDLGFRSSWPIAEGSKVQLAITSVDGATRIPFEGHVTESRHEGNSHHIEVDMASAGVRTAPMLSAATQADSITGSIDLLFGEWMASQDIPGKGDGKRHLVGRLDRVPLTGLLMLFDMERISGELGIMLGKDRFTLFLREGKLIDAAPASDDELRNVLQRIAATSAGKFEFRRCEVEREDRVKTSTTALLIDLARERDEAAPPG
jgi:hypothetical protein